MKLKFVSVLLALCTAAGSITAPAFAQHVQAAPIESESSVSALDNGSVKEQEWEGFTYKTLADHTLEITGYKGTDTALSIPDTIEDKPVTSIGSSAFMGLEKVESVTLPDSITKIKEGAFGECRSLKSITIPKGVVSIPDYVFTYCESLEQVRFPEGLTYIGENAFSGCKSLQSIELPDSLKNIDYFAFQYCTGLSDISFSKNLEHIGQDAFSGCESLKNVTFYEGLRSIGEKAFARCGKLESIALPRSLENIASHAFYACSSLKNTAYAGSKEDRGNMFIFGEGNAPLLQSVITYGSNGKSERFAPKKGTRLKDNGVTYQVKTDVSELAFVKTTDKASKIRISSGVKIDGVCYTVASVTKNAFLNNKKITKVTIQGNVKSIGKSAFKGCSKLNKIVIRSYDLETVGTDAFKGIHPSAVVKVPDLNLTEYKKILKNKGQGSRVKIVAL